MEKDQTLLGLLEFSNVESNRKVKISSVRVFGTLARQFRIGEQRINSQFEKGNFGFLLGLPFMVSLFFSFALKWKQVGSLVERDEIG